MGRTQTQNWSLHLCIYSNFDNDNDISDAETKLWEELELQNLCEYINSENIVITQDWKLDGFM